MQLSLHEEPPEVQRYRLSIGLQAVEAHLLFPYFLEKRLVIPTSPFFIKWFFCYQRVCRVDMYKFPVNFFNNWAGKNLK